SSVTHPAPRTPHHASSPSPTSYLIPRTSYLVPFLALTSLTLIALIARLYAVRDLQIPLFGDSLHHTVIVQLIIGQGGVPISYRPFASVDHYTYHFGFHSLAAVWALLTGQP